MIGFSRVGPAPGIGKGVELRLTDLSTGFAEKNVVIRVREERRIEIDEIDALVRKFLSIPQPLQVIAEIESIHFGSRGFGWHAGTYLAIAGRVNEDLRTFPVENRIAKLAPLR